MAAMTHLWLKAIHVIAIIAWMAGILYFWRLLVYHAMETEAVVIERLKVMERRLRRAIMNPAMVVSVTLGIAMLVHTPAFLKMPWMHVKLLFVFLLLGNHFMATRAERRLAEDPRSISHKRLRFLNEVPTLAMIVIVIMVVVKPACG